MRVKEFGVPPVHDGLILGKESPIGCMSIRKCLELMSSEPFEHLQINDDDTISDIVVRASILRRIPKDRLIPFVLEHVKPLMGLKEVLHLDLEVEVVLEGDIWEG